MQKMKVGKSLFLVLFGLLAISASGSVVDFFAISIGTNDIFQYAWSDGAYVRKLQPNITGIRGPEQFDFTGPDRDLLVADGVLAKVLVLDGVSGLKLKTIGGPDMGQLYGLKVAPDGTSVLVTNVSGNRILRYDISTGQFLGNFATEAQGGLNSTRGLAIGPEGDIYVCSQGTRSIKRFHWPGGEYLGDFTTGAEIQYPQYCKFAPWGDLYVASWGTKQVLRFAAGSGQFLGVVVDKNTSPISDPSACDIGPDGLLYVADRALNIIFRYDPISGQFLGIYAFGSGLSGPEYAAFGPGYAYKPPTAFSVLKGSVFSGNLSDTSESDDHYLILRPGIVVNKSVPPIQIEFEGSVPVATTDQFRVRVEAAGPGGLCDQYVDLWNFTTGAYDLLDFRRASTADLPVDVGRGLSPTDYLEPGTGRMKVKISWKPVGPISGFPWSARIDQVAFFGERL
ncbi:MAG: NHL repeat-containing protein [Armatimonadetes bacterium]|nr:NHL repeat-containing protein [Armatimonadota bacterium]